MGLRHGFGIGLNHHALLKSAASNMGPTHKHPAVNKEYIHKELPLGRMLGPFQDASALPPYTLTVLG